MTGPGNLRVDIAGGDPLGVGDAPVLSWWLPAGACVQHAYRVRTGDGYDTGRVDSPRQSFVELPVFDRSRRATHARVKVWTDTWASDWSEPVHVDAGLLHESDWSAA